MYGRAEDLLALGALIELHKLVTVVGGRAASARTALAQGRWPTGWRGILWTTALWLVETGAGLPIASIVGNHSGRRVCVSSSAPKRKSRPWRRHWRRELDADRARHCEHLLNAVAELAAALHRACPRNVRLLDHESGAAEGSRKEHVYRLGAPGPARRSGCVEKARGKAGACGPVRKGRLCAGRPTRALCAHRAQHRSWWVGHLPPLWTANCRWRSSWPLHRLPLLGVGTAWPARDLGTNVSAF